MAIRNYAPVPSARDGGGGANASYNDLTAGAGDGGGSSYTSITGSMTTGAGTIPGNSGDPDQSGAGNGGAQVARNADGNNGTNGRIVIYFLR